MEETEASDSSDEFVDLSEAASDSSETGISATGERTRSIRAPFFARRGRADPASAGLGVALASAGPRVRLAGWNDGGGALGAPTTRDAVGSSWVT